MTRTPSPAVRVGVALALAAGAAIQAAPAEAPGFLAGVQVGTVEETAVNEASGLAGSRANPGVLWTHNDSGGLARAYAMTRDGTSLGVYSIAGASAVDWEDMAVGPGPTAGQQYLYLGDIGDNSAVRGVTAAPIVVYRVPEPDVGLTQTPGAFTLTGADAITLTYPDGARDAETLMVDPFTGDLYVVSKRETYSRVYRAAAGDLVDGATVTLEFKAELPWGWATGGDISPDGSWILIRGYSSASLWVRPETGDLWDAFGDAPVSAPLLWEPQGEAVAFDAAGRGYFTVSEGVNQPIYYFSTDPPTPGDANADGLIDGSDYTAWADNYNTTGNPAWSNGGWTVGNWTEDGIVDGADYTAWADHYGNCGSAVPEPATLLVMAAAGLPLLLRRERSARRNPELASGLALGGLALIRRRR